MIVATADEVKIISENWNVTSIFDRLLNLALAAIAQDEEEVNPTFTSDRLGVMAGLSWAGLQVEEQTWIIANCGFLP